MNSLIFTPFACCPKKNNVEKVVVETAVNLNIVMGESQQVVGNRTDEKCKVGLALGCSASINTRFSLF